MIVFIVMTILAGSLFRSLAILLENLQNFSYFFPFIAL
jgi:hypothetical protein